MARSIHGIWQFSAATIVLYFRLPKDLALEITDKWRITDAD
jgi:hypothetical protein